MHCAKYKPRNIKTRCYAKYNKVSYQNDLINLDWSDVINLDDANSAWSLFKNKLMSIMNAHAPPVEKSVKGRDCPWLSNEIRNKMKVRDRLLKQARKSRKEYDWNEYKNSRNSVTRSIRLSRHLYNKRLLGENITEPKQFWDSIKRCYSTSDKNSSTSTSFTIDNTLTTDKSKIANSFCTFFTNVVETILQSLPTLTKASAWSYHDDYESPFVNMKSCRFSFGLVSEEDVKKAVIKFKNSKSPGYDDLPISLLKDGVDQLSPILSHLVNKCIAQSVFPSAEKIAKVVPIYKSGSKQSMDNYRPISVLPVLSKVFEKVVHKQLSEYLEKNDLLSKNQYGFRNGRSTQQAITILTDHIATNIDKRKYTGAVFIDLRKAFDMVDHGRLLSKLSWYGIKSKETYSSVIIYSTETNMLL